MRNYKILCLALCTSAITFAQKSVLIRYQPKVGTTLMNNMDADMNITIKAGEQNIVTKMKMAFDMSYHTKARNKDVNSIDMVFEKITMDISNPMMSGSYDSDNKEETDPFALKIAESFKGVLDKPVPMKITTQGAFAEPIDIVKIFPQIPASKANELKEQMSNQFIQFPDKKVKVGESWTMSTTMNQVGDLEYTYTLVGIEKQRLLLTVEGKMLESESETVKMLTANISGDVVLDKKTGETLESNIVMDMDMQMEAQGNTMDMNMKAEIGIKAIQL
ncbi:DUF6263 family protein [Flavicella sp.]|uniref:DUF6263 family protein n=1 Tax=Flavicella sp. TaxID=2957742 RepID=UPI002629DEB0|nr:DUF6263 family protein [Flavicella sp.]MDG1805189.1 DUF6263 family protein [Flavicella sp.]